MLIDYQKVNIYQDAKLVLKDVNFSVEEGEFIYIIGKVGSGKSSLLKTFYGELDIDEGDRKSAKVLGKDVATIRTSEIPALRRQMGIIFQDFQLLHDRTVARNLHFVLRATGWNDKQKINVRIDEVLAAVGMSEKKEKMPHELSGGEQQRIAIARALLNDPKIIIADEPTGNLDPETAAHIVQILQDATAKGTTVIMSTHNINLLDQFPGKVYQCLDHELVDVSNPVALAEAAEEE